MAIATAGVRGLTLGSKFLLVVVLARYFRPEDVGAYGLMVSSVTIAAFALALEYHYFTRRVLIARRAGAQAAVVRDQAVLHFLVAALVLPPLAVLFWSGTWAPVPRSAQPWFFYLVVVELASQEAGQALVALSRPLASNLVLFVRSAVWAYPVLVLVLTRPGSREIESVFGAWALGATASLAVAAWCLRGIGWRSALTEPVDWAGMRSGLRVAAPFVVTTGASLGLLFIDRFIIEAYYGLVPVGVYVFFTGITTALPTLVNTGVALVRMPRLVKAQQDADERRFRAEFGAMTRTTIVGTSLLATLMAAGIAPLLGVVGKTIYADSVGVFFLLLVAAFVRSIADLPIYALYARYRDLSLLAVNLLAFAVSILLNLVLVPSLGLIGAGLAAIAGALALLLAALAFELRSGDPSRPHHEEQPLPAVLEL